MAKKQTQPKTIIIKAPKPKSFDLSFTKPNENMKILAAIQTLQANAGWHFLTQVFQENIKFLERQIITKIDPETGKELTDAQIDLLRFKHAYLTELLNKPEQFIKQLSRTDQAENDLDPYDKGEQP